jgi:hypothetical protein
MGGTCSAHGRHKMHTKLCSEVPTRKTEVCPGGYYLNGLQIVRMEVCWLNSSGTG